MGRFYFKPAFKSTATIWPGSIFEYTFGTHAFGTEASCQIVHGTTGPTGTLCGAVSTCVISSSKIKITMAKAATSIDFFVVINRASNWVGGGEVSGTVSSYGMLDI
jgi:hypothetical protein